MRKREQQKPSLHRSGRGQGPSGTCASLGLTPPQGRCVRCSYPLATSPRLTSPASRARSTLPPALWRFQADWLLWWRLHNGERMVAFCTASVEFSVLDLLSTLRELSFDAVNRGKRRMRRRRCRLRACELEKMRHSQIG
jgi:hypothetical protein